MSWTWTIPSEPGWYWFLGCLWMDHPVTLQPVRVTKHGFGLYYAAHDMTAHPKHGLFGVWKKANLPERIMG